MQQCLPSFLHLMRHFLQIRFRQEVLKFRFPFRIAHGTRASTEIVYVEVTDGQYVGWGEAAFPPYLKYSVSTGRRWLEHASGLELSSSAHPGELWSLLLERLGPEMPALAAMDMAIWDFYLKKENQAFPVVWNSKAAAPLSSYTIAVCEEEEMLKRLEHGRACGYTFYKLKLDGKTDRRQLENYKRYSNDPFAVDANQSWHPNSLDIPFLTALEQSGCVLVEQPFASEHNHLVPTLKAHLSMPIIADESCQVASDVGLVSQYFDGVNVKLQKCGGLTPAIGMVKELRQLGKKVLIGCMSESSTGIKAARYLAGGADWVDLDGPDLIVHSPQPF